MMREILFLVSSFLVCWKGVYPFLDIDELKNIHYDIDIIDKPVLIGRPLDQEVIYMTSKYGQRYECQLPDITELELEMEEEKAASEIGVSELLKAMESAPCIMKTKDWWSYEFCYGKHIRQFHLEKEQIIGDIVVLGVYESETDWRDDATTDSRKNRLNRYHSQHYVNGSICDLSGISRQAEVRFHCAEGEGDSIARIDEPSTCSYILTIHTTKICHHPYLKPPPKVKPRSVLCSPALTQHQFDVYRHHEEQAELELERERERLRQKKGAELKWAQELLGVSTKYEDEDGATNDDDTDDVTKMQDLETLVEEYSDRLNIENLGEAIAMGVDPKVLADVVRNIAESVQSTVDAIDEELDLEADVEMADGEESADADDKGELDELDQKDFKSLLAKYRENIEGSDMDGNKAARMQALADELEKSYDDVDALEQLVVEDDDDYESHEDEYEGGRFGGIPDDDDDEWGNNWSSETQREAEKMLVSKVNELIKKLKTEPDAEGDKSETDEDESEDSSDSNRVKIRVTRIKMNPETGADETQRDVNLYDPEQRRLEETIQDHLEQAGIKVEGGKIELKVLTYKPDTWPDDGEGEGSITILTEEETTYFKNIVSGILGHHGQAEEGQHRKLENNYRFHWDQSSHRIEEEGDKDEDQSTDSSVFT